jgi:hypothetical protein
MNLAVQPNANFVGQNSFSQRPKEEPRTTTGISYSVSPTGQVSSHIQSPTGGSQNNQQTSNFQGSTL